MYLKVIKPLWDKLTALIVLVIFAPLIIVITLIIYITTKRSPFFIQPRPGYRNRIFYLIKFRTMTDVRDSFGNLLPDDERITRLGHWVRKTSLDELLQLINVLRGDMSLVGPRPLLTEYLPLYNSIQVRRHEVKPGITGWAQINGRNAVTWQSRFEMDVWYVDNVSFLLDIKIIFLTIVKVFRAEGISGTNTSTMEKFQGGQ